jgi:hypothetical protein
MLVIVRFLLNGNAVAEAALAKLFLRFGHGTVRRAQLTSGEAEPAGNRQQIPRYVSERFRAGSSGAG